MLTLLLLACTASVFGPGPGEWETGNPKDYGLDYELLEQASKKLESEVLGRDCLVVARRGKVVFEKYYGESTKSSKFDVDAFGKTAISALVGIAASVGLLDLDIPLIQYNIAPVANWSRSASGADYYQNVTARHLLSQVSGVGEYNPGTKWTYDTFIYTRHLISLLEKVVPDNYLTLWAKKVFSLPLGMDLYPFGVWASGGATLTCREMLKLGQLLLNKGSWRSPTGQLTELVNSDYVDEMQRPHYEEVSQYYGLLTWLNGKSSSDRSHGSCCAPRWTIPVLYEIEAKPTENCTAETLSNRLIDSGMNTSFLFGELGKHLIVDHQNELLILNYGTTWGSSNICDLAKHVGNYDELFTLRHSYDILKESVSPNDLSVFALRNISLIETVIPITLAENKTLLLGPVMFDLSLESCVLRCDDEQSCLQVAFIEGDVSICKLYSDCTGGDGRVFQHCDKRAVEKVDGIVIPPPSTLPSRSVFAVTGSCLCRCPPDQGIGKCFDIKMETGLHDPCRSLSSLANESCPSVGLIQECPSNNTCTLARHSCTRTSSCSADGVSACMCHQDIWRRCEFRPNLQCSDSWFSPSSTLSAEWFEDRRADRQWSGANAYHLWAESSAVQEWYLSTMVEIGMKVLRVVVKAHGEYSDLEPTTPGQYDDTVLELIDTLVSRANAKGIMVIVAAHDRWTLGCGQPNAYTIKYKDTLIQDPSTPCKGAQVDQWYFSASVIVEMTNRLRHILNYRSPITGRRWGDMNESFFAFDPQHAAQWGSSPSQTNDGWLCELTKMSRSYSKIAFSTGGDSSDVEALAKCEGIDFLAVQIYPYATDTEVLKNLNSVRVASLRHKKRFFVEDVGLTPERVKLLSLSFATVPWVGTGMEWTDIESAKTDRSKDLTEVSSFQQWPEIWSPRTNQSFPIPIPQTVPESHGYSAGVILGIVLSIGAGVMLIVSSAVHLGRQLSTPNDSFCDDEEALAVLEDSGLAE